MKIKSIEDEREIAATAAKVLHERFIEAARTETVLNRTGFVGDFFI